ncbi:hypothetical protein BH11ACT5_BH11ACT5_15750 [soil metagenome]
MKTLHSATVIAAAALLALTLAGCAPAADTSTDTSSGDDTSTDSGDITTDDGGSGDLITLSGSGDYTVGVTAPIGGYELKDVDSQPDGCTWALEDADGNIQFENQGTTVFITDVNAFFQTSGCPDWVQFE